MGRNLVMEDDDDYVEYVPIAKRRAMQAESLETRKRKRLHSEKMMPELPNMPRPNQASLFESRKVPETSAPEQIVLQEKELIENLSDKKTFMSVWESAKGIKYTEPLFTGWKPPLKIRRMPENEKVLIRKKMHIDADGEDIPPPIKKFKNMSFPNPILDVLKRKGIRKPTPIQAQGLPVILSGRDMVGISYTGSGKTLTFVLPMIMMALQDEMTMPVVSGEGPIGLVVCPSRDLANQTFQLVKEFVDSMNESGFPELRALLCIGEKSIRDQIEAVKRGVHIVVATPGRLKKLLTMKKMNLNACRFLTLDEADRLVDSSFEDDIKLLFDHFKAQRQTLLFSATMPARIRNLARTGLVKPVIVNVGRAGAANLNVIQEVEYVKNEAKFVYLLECMKKTAPRVLIFCKNKTSVDDVSEYLVIKGVNAMGVHKDVGQEQRDHAISSFKSGKTDVLVATDLVSKGLDFPNVQHVINFDMPEAMEDYVHRIGRTGRCGKTGVATTFINKDQSATTLVDLKRLLQEAKQRIPPVLAELHDQANEDAIGVMGCGYCGGLGHRTHDCPKMEQQNRRKMMTVSGRDYFGSGGYKGEI